MPLKSRQSKLRELLEARKLEELKKVKEEEKNLNLKKLQNEKEEGIRRASTLRRSTEIFSSILSKFNEVKTIEKKFSIWKSYFENDKLQDGFISTQSFRDLLAMLELENQLYYDQNFNWYLKCDERCLLTQVSVDDSRRMILKPKYREMMEKFYEQKIKSLLAINDRLMDIISKINIEKDSRNRSIHSEEFIRIKNNELKTLFDRSFNAMTIEVAQHIDRQMDRQIDPREVVYEFESSNFSFFIWSFKDVPFSRDIKNNKPYKNIRMNPLQCDVKVSNWKIKFESIFIRGIWLRNDMLSDRCPSYLIQKPIYLNVCDLKSAVEIEMKVRQTMIENRLEEMKKTRAEYEEVIRKQQEMEEENKKSSKSNRTTVVKADKKVKKRNNKSENTFNEPPVVDDTTYIDVEDEYLIYEDAFVVKQIAFNSPQNLQLSQDELNLREFRVINGEITIEGFEKLHQPIALNQHFFMNLSNDQSSLEHSEIFQDSSSTVFNVDNRKKKKEVAEQNPKDLAEVEIRLNDSLFWWREAPKICRWESKQKKESNLVETILGGNLFSAPPTYHYAEKIHLRDFKLDDFHEGVNRVDLAKYYLVPQMPVEFKFFQEQLKIFNRKCLEWEHILKDRKTFSKIEESKSTASLKKFIEKRCHIDWTIDDLENNFFIKKFEPRELFPEKHMKMIEVLSSHQLNEAVVTFENVSPLGNGEKEKYFIVENQPKAHLKLSELLDQIEKLQFSLKPFIEEEEKIRKMSSDDFSNLMKKSGIISDKTEHNGKWTCEGVRPEKFDPVKKTMSFHIENFGTFALAVPKYCHFPFKNVELSLFEDDSKSDTDNQMVSLKLSTQNTTIKIQVSKNGYSFLLPDIMKHPLKSYEKLTMSEFKDLKSVLDSLNLSIFPEDDAKWYIKDLQEKHIELERHTSWSMAFFSTNYKFKLSPWNYKCHRRVIILEARKCDPAKAEPTDIPENTFKIIKVTPLRTTSVEVIDDNDGVPIFQTSPSDQDFKADLFSFLDEDDLDVEKIQHNMKNFILIHKVNELLLNLRPFSFCR